ncbi:MAG: site-specific integrase [Alcaligenaceae bacterium]|nr:site-specific integrase [Alcaligenaceae bacterium]
MEFERRPFLPTELVNHLLSITHEIRPKTFLAYRSALLYWLNTQPPSSEKHNAILALNAEIPRSGFKGVAPDKPATLYSNKSQRKRTFRQKDFQKLMAELNSRIQSKLHRTAQIAQHLMFWLQAGLATGLRPIEWEHAVWEDEENGVLRVQTAKRKTGSYSLPALKDLPPQAERTRIINVDKDKIIWVSQHMIRVKNHLLQGLSFQLYYNNVRTYLWKVNKELFGNNTLNLYMLRGQFASNQKGSGMTVEEVAEIMGCSPLVAQVNYGKKVNAHRSSRYPAPSAYKNSKNSNNNPMKPT